MRRAAPLISLVLVIGAAGCACRPPLGEPIQDSVRRTALLRASRAPDVREAIFRTVIRWPGREISLTEVVKPSAEGGFSVAGVTDIGSTLYAVRVDAGGAGRVIAKALPFSDRWLLDGLVAELLLPWNGPTSACQLYRQPDGTWALAESSRCDTRVFLFDAPGIWRQFRRFTGGRLRVEASFEWDEHAVPKVIRTHNLDEHYRVVRERVSLR